MQHAKQRAYSAAIYSGRGIYIQSTAPSLDILVAVGVISV